MREKILIGKPYITNTENKSCLCADISIQGTTRVMYFEVEKCWGKFLCYEVADCFLIGLLNYAFANGFDIKCDAPISGRLLYQVNNYIVKTMPTVGNSCYKTLSIFAEPLDVNFGSAYAVGTSASGGVDSYYSITKHVNDNCDKSFKLTHLLIANQFNIYNDEETTRQQFEKLLEESRKIAENYGLELVSIFTNHNDFLFDGFVQQYSYRICSYVFALQKLFRIYYVSSGVPFREYSFTSHDSDGFDIFNLSMLSTDNLTFYSSGGEVTRTQKITYFCEDRFVQNHLKVCNDDLLHNCSKCEKCLRTMLSLDIIGKLECFSSVFDLANYQHQKVRYLSTVEAGEIEASSDLIENIKKYNYKVPFRALFIGKIFLKGVSKLKHMLRRVKFIKWFYFYFKIDFVRFGEEKARVYRYGTKYELK